MSERDGGPVERPILFNGHMVRALLAGTKTQTRRALAPDLFISSGGAVVRMASAGPATTGIREAHCPYWREPGDRLWVRETWSTHACLDHLPPGGCPKSVHYWADGEIQTGKRRPSIHMPRRLSRITLEVTGVCVERLQDISEADALAEGIVPTCGGYGLPAGEHYHAADPRQSYFSLWESTNGPGSVEANPWLWCVEFRRVEVGHG